MTSATKVSSCVECATPIIGERLRCPACHEQHASAVVAASPRGPADTTNDTTNDAADDALTVPRPKQRVRVSNRETPTTLARLRVIAEVIGAVVLAVVLIVKGCS